jgi:hypothetical protein
MMFSGTLTGAPNPKNWRANQLWVRRGVLLSLSNDFWNTVSNPGGLNLPVSLMFGRAHFLYDPAGRGRSAQEIARARWADRDWRAGQLSAELRAIDERIRAWKPDPAGHFFGGLVANVSRWWGLLQLAATNGCTPSTGRRALLDLECFAHALDLDFYAEAGHRVLGLDRIDEAEIARWTFEFGAHADRVNAECAGVSPELAYYRAGAEALLARGHARAVLFPLWEGLLRIVSTLPDDPAMSLLLEIATRLGIDSPEVQLERVKTILLPAWARVLAAEPALNAHIRTV